MGPSNRCAGPNGQRTERPTMAGKRHRMDTRRNRPRVRRLGIHLGRNRQRQATKQIPNVSPSIRAFDAPHGLETPLNKRLAALRPRSARLCTLRAHKRALVAPRLRMRLHGHSLQLRATERIKPFDRFALALQQRLALIVRRATPPDFALRAKACSHGFSQIAIKSQFDRPRRPIQANVKQAVTQAHTARQRRPRSWPPGH